MKILDFIDKAAHGEGLEYLLIGGHAINAIGDRRQTRDIDLLACKTDRDRWKALLSGMDYNLFNESDAFLQFSPAEVTQWPIDLMLVDEKTFRELKDEARPVNLGGQHDVLIPSVKHIIALKLHALKQGDPVRRLKDLLDIITLIRYDQIDVGSDNFKQLCEKYATVKVYEEIVETLDK